MALTVGLVYGGKGAEAGINIAAAKDFAQAIAPYGCQSRYIDINKPETLKQLAGCAISVGIEKTAQHQDYIDLFDKAVQYHGVEHIGQSDATRMALRDKSGFAATLAQQGINAPHGHFCAAFEDEDIKTVIKYIDNTNGPFVVKPNSSSLSEGVSYAETPAAAKVCATELFNKKSPFLVQNYISGPEVVCPVAQAMGMRIVGQPLEIVYSGPIYDFQTKNVSLNYDIKTPPRAWDDDLQKQMRRVMDRASKAAQTSFAIRLDTRIHQGNIHVIEGNAEPDMTKNDLLASSFQAVGLSYGELALGMMSNAHTFNTHAAKNVPVARQQAAVQRKIEKLRLG